MPPAVVAQLAARATRKQAKKGQRVLARADRAQVILLVTGRLEVVADHADEVTLVRSLLPPAVVGVSVAAGATPSAELWAAEDVELAVIPADDVAAALRKHPEAALAAIAHLGGVIAELSSEIAALRVHGLATRIRHRLEQLGRGRREVEITHARLAEEVGGTRANVSRALAQLEREGIVYRRRGRIELRARQGNRPAVD
jgi:CRP/FNR family transcriptional regulator